MRDVALKAENPLSLPGRVTPTSLTLPDNLSEQEWQDIGRRLVKIGGRIMWHIGDWWAFGEGHRYGSRKQFAAQMEAEGGFSFQTCANAAWVAAKIPTSRRREVLPWSHHAEVAGLEPVARDSALAWAESKWPGVSQREVRAYVKQLARRADYHDVEEAGDLPSDNQYRCIVIDPPWPLTGKITLEARPEQISFDYPTMTEQEIVALDVPGMAANDCHLFCWTTQKFLPMALRVIDAWGFHYVLTMVWHKTGGYQPLGLPQYNCEFIVYARRGAPKFEDTKAFNCCFNAPRREHSRKPNEFYDLVRRVTAGPRIDVFSREPRDGFDQWGNQVHQFALA